MKKLLLLTLAFFAISCVDRNFDLGKVENDEIVFGDEFTVPMGTIKINLSDFFDSPVPTRSDIHKDASAKQIIIESKTKVFTLSNKAVDGITELLSNKEMHSIKATISQTIPGVTFDLNLKTGTTSISVERVKNDTTAIISEITTEVLEAFLNSTSIEIEFKVISGAGKVVTIKESDVMAIDLKLQVNGGIKL